MEIFIAICCIAWVIGWLHSCATIHAAVESKKLQDPGPGTLICSFILMLFTWPYWFFYWRA